MTTTQTRRDDKAHLAAVRYTYTELRQRVADGTTRNSAERAAEILAELEADIRSTLERLSGVYYQATR